MIFIALWMVALMIYSCAAVATPDGGPKDETPPQFISAMPEACSLHFKGGKVSIKFSEYISEKSIKNAVKISPHLDLPAEIKYADDELIINFPEDLLPDQTYVITINRNLRDEQGHSEMLKFLQAEPLLSLGMRLGEGTEIGRASCRERV